MNKLLGAMVLLLGVTQSAVTGNAIVNADKVAKALNSNNSHIIEISALDDNQLSKLCDDIATTDSRTDLKTALINQCKINIVNTDMDIAQELQKIIDSKN